MCGYKTYPTSNIFIYPNALSYDNANSRNYVSLFFLNTKDIEVTKIECQNRILKQMYIQTSMYMDSLNQLIGFLQAIVLSSIVFVCDRWDGKVFMKCFYQHKYSFK